VAEQWIPGRLIGVPLKLAEVPEIQMRRLEEPPLAAAAEMASGANDGGVGEVGIPIVKLESQEAVRGREGQGVGNELCMLQVKEDDSADS
jgi:hypothetical protein